MSLPERVQPHASDLESVTFYHPSRMTGGSEVLFARCAVILKDQYGIDVNVIDHADGALRGLLSNRPSEFRFFSDITDPMLDLSNTVVLVSARNILQFYSRLPASLASSQLSVVFWLLHPAELYAQLGIGYDRIKRSLGYKTLRRMVRMNPGTQKFRAVVQELAASGSLQFMDSAVLAESEWILDIKIKNPNFLHLLTGLSAAEVNGSARTGRKLVLISRLESFKIPGILKVLNDLAAAYEQGLWRGDLTIIGSGAAFEALATRASQLPFEAKFTGHIPVAALRDALIEGEYSVLLGMGMSILEGAALGLPCIILPTSDSVIKDDCCYATLDPTEDSLGEYYDFPEYKLERHGLSDLLVDIFNRWDKYQARSVQFFAAYYEAERSSSELYHALTEVGKRTPIRLGWILKMIATMRALRS